ncbi:MAG: endonuclease/exonuclease/phosphatase family protein, partial [Pseudomonas sp.]
LSIQSVLVIADGVPRFANAMTSRPAVGVRLRLQGLAEDIVVANIHAVSGGGANSPRLLREISWHANTPYVLLGDFNRDPRAADAQHPDRGDWVSPPDIAQVIQANGSTHPSTSPQNMLDYAVSDGAMGPLLPGAVDVAGPSDHLAVSYSFNFT